MNKELASINPDLIRTSFASIYEAKKFYQQQVEAVKPPWYDTVEQFGSLVALPPEYFKSMQIVEALQAEINHFKVYRRLKRYVRNHKEEKPDYHLSKADPQKLLKSFESINRAVQSSQLFSADQKREFEEWLIGKTSHGGYIAKSVAATIISARIIDKLGDTKTILTEQDRRILHDAHRDELLRAYNIIAPILELFEPPTAEEEHLPPALSHAA